MTVSESVFGSGFDMEAYLAKRALEIQDLTDRKLFKEVVDKLFLGLCQYTQEQYQSLEERVFGEFKATQSEYAVYIGLIDRPRYDATDTFLIPMDIKDTKETEISLSELQEAMKSKQPYQLYTIYLNAAYAKTCRFEQDGRVYQGQVKTDRGSYQATFSVARNKSYLKMIEDLYYIFGANYRAWTTVCCGYLYKLFDISLLSVEAIDPKELIQEISVDFEEYDPYVRYNMIPLWNLCPVKEKTSTYPEPCMDKTNFDHRIFAQKLDPISQYLVTNTEVEVTNIRRLDGDLIITCPEENPLQWPLYRVNRRPAQLKYPYPVLSNECSESFAGNLADIYRKSVKTVSEVARLVEAFGYQNYIAFLSIGLVDDDGLPAQTYDMDSFITDELRVEGAKKIMELRFHAKDPEDVLVMDIMSFLVTQVQKLFPEYLCRGKLVQEAVI